MNPKANKDHEIEQLIITSLPGSLGRAVICLANGETDNSCSKDSGQVIMEKISSATPVTAAERVCFDQKLK